MEREKKVNYQEKFIQIHAFVASALPNHAYSEILVKRYILLKNKDI